jgi:RecJ-like exonuclease
MNDHEPDPPCPTCKGDGYLSGQKGSCPDCRGGGVVPNQGYGWTKAQIAAHKAQADVVSLITIKATKEYRDFLAVLATAAEAESTAELYDRAITDLARRHRLAPPRRMPPIGRPKG